MWFQSKGTPMARHAGSAHADLCGHQMGAPMCGRFGFALDGWFNQPCDIDHHQRWNTWQVWVTGKNGLQPSWNVLMPLLFL
jgi:hypothetical protein